jgi:hypothetical protein
MQWGGEMISCQQLLPTGRCKNISRLYDDDSTLLTTTHLNLAR